MNPLFIAPILLLCISNLFMTFAWYGQLKFPSAPLKVLIPACWGIALLEYCFAVPANHFGARVYSAVQLKTMQEVITLVVFAGFSVWYLGEPLRWNHAVAFAFLVLAAYFAFAKFGS
ncbi:MAG: DMT family protein [Alphaproteobacteria bacterium]|nr:DMT family protein [Alphaproteobacteria bacterium]